jgi:hypothetical protein
LAAFSVQAVNGELFVVRKAEKVQVFRVEIGQAETEQYF